MSQKMNEKHFSLVIIIRSSYLLKKINVFSFCLEDLYNILTIHGIVSLTEKPKSILDLNQFSKTTSYKIGPHIYSLDDIEHGILRGSIEPI